MKKLLLTFSALLFTISFFAQDLIITNVDMPSEVKYNQSLNTSITVKNQSEILITRSIFVKMTLSVDEIFGNEDDISFSGHNAKILNANESINIHLKSLIESNIAPNSYNTLFEVNYNNNVIETNKENNDYNGGTLMIKESDTDLYFSNISIDKTTLKKYDTFNVDYSISNNGIDNILGRINITFYLSKTQSIDENSKEYKGIFIEEIELELMNSNISHTLEVIPDFFNEEYGEYYLIAKIKNSDKLYESNYTNNIVVLGEKLNITNQIPDIEILSPQATDASNSDQINEYFIYGLELKNNSNSEKTFDLKIFTSYNFFYNYSPDHQINSITVPANSSKIIEEINFSNYGSSFCENISSTLTFVTTDSPFNYSTNVIIIDNQLINKQHIEITNFKLTEPLTSSSTNISFDIEYSSNSYINQDVVKLGFDSHLNISSTSNTIISSSESFYSLDNQYSFDIDPNKLTPGEYQLNFSYEYYETDCDYIKKSKSINKTIIISEPTSYFNINILGTDNSEITDSEIFFYKKVENGIILHKKIDSDTYLNSLNVDVGEYTFLVMPKGSFEDGYAPTYYGDTPYIKESSWITIDENDYQIDTQINLASKTILESGPFSVSGNISSDIGQARNNGITSSNLEAVTILLLNMTGQVVAETSSDSNGDYIFNNLPEGRYQILVQFDLTLTTKSTPYAIVVDENKIINFNIVNDGNIYANELITLAILKDSKLDNQAYVFPNPFTSSITISDKSIRKYSIIDLKGRVLISRNLNNKSRIDLNELSNGIYFIKLLDSKGNQTIEKIIKQ